MPAGAHDVSVTSSSGDVYREEVSGVHVATVMVKSKTAGRTVDRCQRQQ